MRSSLGWLLFGLTVAAPARAQSVPETKYDIVGIKVGTPIKEALAALKVHNPNLRLQPESLQYGSLPNALTYAISAEGASEVFYFLVTMPPNPIVVSKITWTAKFTVENPPKQDELVATLAKKYGPITWDTLPASLTLGSRETGLG